MLLLAMISLLGQFALVAGVMQLVLEWRQRKTGRKRGAVRLLLLGGLLLILPAIAFRLASTALAR